VCAVYAAIVMTFNIFFGNQEVRESRHAVL